MCCNREKEENSLRWYRCKECKCEMVICRYCDRGNKYCSRRCANESRCELLNAARKRYEETEQGKRKHRARQRKYRENKKKVTDHSSQPVKEVAVCESLGNECQKLTVSEETKPSEEQSSDLIGKTKRSICHFCKRIFEGFLRYDRLGRSTNYIADTT